MRGGWWSRLGNAPFLPFLLIFFLISLGRPTTCADPLHSSWQSTRCGGGAVIITVKAPINTDTNNYFLLEKYSLPYIKLAAAPTFTDLDVQFPPTVRLSTNGPWVKILNDAKDEFEVDGAVAVFSTLKVEEEDPFNMSDIRIALKLELAE